MIKPLISAIVPCRNEEGNLPRTLTRLNEVVDEVIVVDNGSTDRSVEIATQYGARIIDEPRKQNGIGYGYALMSGFENARGYHVVTVDADGEHEIEKIPELISHLINENLDFISCHRETTKSKHINTKIRRLGVALLGIEIGLLYGYIVKDTLSGMWIMKGHVPQRLNLTQGDWNMSPEIKLSAISNPTVGFAEYPIQATVRSHGESKQILWKTALQHGIFIIKYRYMLATQAVHRLYHGTKQIVLSQKISST